MSTAHHGTLLQPESDFAIPEPLELIPPNPDPDANERNKGGEAFASPPFLRLGPPGI